MTQLEAEMKSAAAELRFEEAALLRDEIAELRVLPVRGRRRARSAVTASRYPPPMADRLVVRGAREHNLQDVSLDLPRDKLIVFTGLSGSGKSSLAFDTIYAEGQRRYVESLSAYARQFLGQMDKPDVDFIEGLSPAISIDQKSASRNPRSTVGTITEVYDYLRLLYARIGHPHCPNCGRPVARQTPQQIVDRVLELPEGTKFQVLAPVVRGRKGEYSTLLDDLAKQGFARVRVDGSRSSSPTGPRSTLARYELHTIEVVVDRLVRRDGIRQRLTESIETALELTGGTAEVLVMDGTATRTRGSPSPSTWPAPTAASASTSRRRAASPSTRPTAPARPVSGWAPGSRSTPSWWCPTRPSRWPRGRWPRGPAPAASTSPGCRPGVAELGGFSFDAPWKSLKAKDKKLVLYGTGTKPVHVTLQEPLRPQALVRGALRGDRPVAAAAPRRVRVGLVPRADRAVHARGGLPRLPRGPAQARVAGGHRGRPQHLRAVQPVHRQRRGGHGRRSSSATGST